MDNLEIMLSFEQTRNNILNKIQKTKEKWQKLWQEAQDNPAVENELIYLKLEIQIMETQAIEELEKLEEEIRGVEGERK